MSTATQQFPPMATAPKPALSLAEQYFVPDHVHICVLSHGTVVLDLKRDRFTGLGTRETEIILEIIRPSNSSDSGIAIHNQQMSETVDSLLQSGLISPNRGDTGKHHVSVDPPNARASVGEELLSRPRMSAEVVTAFISAYISATAALRWQTLYGIVMDVQNANLEAPFRPPSNIELIVDLVSAFRCIRPYIFPARNNCLRHALTLIRFLNRFRIYPRWIIGVRLRPWGAHSWVQVDDLILDSSPEKTVEFKPILTV